MAVNQINDVLLMSDPPTTAWEMEDMASAAYPGEADVPRPQSLPNYIKALSCSKSDLETLRRQDGLAIPPGSLRDRILRAFADFVFPCMPIVPLQRIIRAIDRNDGTDAIHLLLFQAIMFSGVAHVELEHLQSHGYQSHRFARRKFFGRVEATYELLAKADTDPVVLIQSLLLMTFWYDSSTDSKDSYHWMRIILSLSQALGMHNDSTLRASTNPDDCRLWRRIAWFTYVRDRMILLGARRPASIEAAEFKLPLLTVDDFDLDPLERTGPSCLPDDCRLFRDPRRLRQMATLCVEQTRLSLYIDCVATLQQELATRDTELSVPAILTCNRRLQTWWAEVLARDDNCAQPWLVFQPGDESAMVQRSMLLLTHSATVSALHRPLARMIADNTLQVNTHLQGTLRHSSTVALNKATDETTKLACHLYRLGLWIYLPANAVTSLLSAIIGHLTNIGSGVMGVKDSSLLGFSQCLRLIGQLQTLWANAGDVCAFLDDAIAELRSGSEQQTYEVMELSNIVDSVRRGSTGNGQAPDQMALHSANGESTWMLQGQNAVFQDDLGLNLSANGEEGFSVPDFMSELAALSGPGPEVSTESYTPFDIDDILQFDQITEGSQDNDWRTGPSEKEHYWTSVGNDIFGLSQAT